MAEKHPEYVGDPDAPLDVDYPETADETDPVYRTHEFALDVAGFGQAGVLRRFDLDVKRETAPCRRKRYDYDDGEVGPEDIGRADD